MSSVTSKKTAPVAVLLDPKVDIPLGEKNVKLDDYLNDKIQTRADFASLPSLLAKVEGQRRDLENQLQDARLKLEESKNASANHTSHMLKQTRLFEKQQENVRKRLMVVVRSDTPEEATALLKGPLEKLRRVELAKSYVELLKDVDEMTKEARNHLPERPKDALLPYIKLKELSMHMVELQQEAEGAAPHLVNYVQSAVTKVWYDMQKIMVDEFEAILKTAKWPEVAEPPTREWQDCFQKLLDLQAPEIVSARGPLVLLPMGVLAKNFVSQFRYHFFTNKATNQEHRLGEFFFQWFVGTVGKWQDWLREFVTPVLAAHFRGSALAGNSLYVDPVAAFITALLPVMKEKVESLAAEVSHKPNLLSRFIPQLMAFDEKLRNEFNYDGGNTDLGWKGLTWDILNTYFPNWLEAERMFAIKRYEEILSTPDRGQIDFDGADPGKTKPTHGATKFTDLVQSITEQYRDLRRFSHKIRFLVDIQSHLLEQYFGVLNDSLSVYMSSITTVGRTLQGISKEEQASLEGIGGLDRLCRMYGSADRVVSVLHEWANDEFFVDLWDQLQDRAKDTEPEDSLAGTMTLNEVARHTSKDLGMKDEGTVFDVHIQVFDRLRQKTGEQIVSAIQYAFPASFKQYFHRPQWRTVGDELVPDPTLMAITPELDSPLQTLKTNMTFLHKALGHAPFRRIWRASFDSLQDLLFHEVLTRQEFTSLGAARLMADINAIQSVVESCVSSSISVSSLGMPKLREGVSLLNLPVQAIGKLGGSESISLKEAYVEIFGANRQAEEMLAKLGFSRLSIFEARTILSHRIEAAFSSDD